MNIFFLSGNPRRCARWHCDKHVVKMILEYTQILYTSHHINGGTALIEASAPLCITTGKHGYKLHSKNHPSVKWACESLAHYLWLLQLAFCLVDEHIFRFAPKNRHSCYKHLLWLSKHLPPSLTTCTWRDPPPAMPDEYKTKDAIFSYWNFYRGSKKDRGLLTYTKRHVPHVFSNEF